MAGRPRDVADAEEVGMGAVRMTALLEAAFVASAFVWRSLDQRRRTGSTGFVAHRERGVVARAAGLSMTVSVVLLAVGPAITWNADGDWDGPLVAGAVLMLGGLPLTLAAQQQMGASWRVGVDPTERTGLVTVGLFAWVRNPIFTAMVGFGVGVVALAVPSPWTVASKALLAASVAVQVMSVEEPYLRRVYGAAYRAYAETSGHFLPRLPRRPSARRRTA